MRNYSHQVRIFRRRSSYPKSSGIGMIQQIHQPDRYGSLYPGALAIVIPAKNEERLIGIR